MSKAPDWMTKAQDNTTGNTVGTVAEVTQKRNKPGPKKSAVTRKNRIIKLSELKSNEIDSLEKLLSMKISMSRGRSETIEMAVSVLSSILNNPEKPMRGDQWLHYLQQISGQEDRDAETPTTEDM